MTNSKNWFPWILKSTTPDKDIGFSLDWKFNFVGVSNTILEQTQYKQTAKKRKTIETWNVKKYVDKKIETIATNLLFLKISRYSQENTCVGVSF